MSGFLYLQSGSQQHASALSVTHTEEIMKAVQPCERCGEDVFQGAAIEPIKFCVWCLEDEKEQERYPERDRAIDVMYDGN